MTTASPSPRFVDTGGRLPAMWPRKAAFFANLLALFFGNEEQTQSLSNEVGEIDSYGGRLIPILNLLFQGDGNVLVLERAPDERLCKYLRDDLGLTLPSMHVMQHRDYQQLKRLLEVNDKEAVKCVLQAVANCSPEWVDGYVTDETLTGIAKYLGCETITSCEASRNGNNKLLLHLALAEAGMPTFDTEIADSAAALPQCARRLAQLGYESAVIRAQIGASGIGMLKLPDLSDADSFPEIPDYFFYEGPCLVQGWLAPGILSVKRIYSPSTQLFVDDESVYAFDMTEQILSHDSIHQGNESPPPYFDLFPGLREETMRQAEVAGSWLHSTGYRGTASIDWLVADREGQRSPDVYVCEINARVTGATYPSLLARHFRPDGSWLQKNLRLKVPVTAEELLSMFERPGHLFHADQNAGIIPLNLNFGADDLVHKGQFLCIGDTLHKCHHFLRLAEADLPVQWHDDRD